MNWRILVSLAIFTPIIRIAYKMAIQEQITQGDLIGACLTALGLLGAASVTIRRSLIHYYPFDMRFSHQPFGTRNAEFSTSLDLQLGKHENIWMRIRLREGRNLELIDLRFMERNWWWTPTLVVI